MINWTEGLVPSAFDRKINRGESTRFWNHYRSVTDDERSVLERTSHVVAKTKAARLQTDSEAQSLHRARGEFLRDVNDMARKVSNITIIPLVTG